jgi:hypothetical protein
VSISTNLTIKKSIFLPQQTDRKMNWIMGRLGPLKTGSQGLEKCFGKRAPACLDAAWVYVCYTSPLVEF